MSQGELERIVRELENTELSKMIAAKVPTSHEPLFNPSTVVSLRRNMKKWRFHNLTEDEKRNPGKTVYALLGSRGKTPRPLVSTPLDVVGLDYIRDVGLPGEGPLTRGIHANMYSGRKFTIRPIIGFGTPEHTNKRIKFLLNRGATGVNIVFDLPTIQGYDSDDPYAKGQVGLCGVSVQTVEDMKALWDGIPIEKMSVSLTTHYPSNTMILLATYLVMAEEKGIRWNELRGTVQNDMVMESVVRSAPSSLPPEAVFKLQVDNIEYIRREVPLWNYVTFNGYNLREAGTDEITEVAVAFSNALETTKELMKRGHSPDSFLDRMAFFWDVGNDFFAEIAKMRAARRLWYRIAKFILRCKLERSLQCRFHTQTSGVSLTRVEPFNNIPRSTLQGLAAVLGGAQSLHLSGYDEAFSVPTEQAHLLSLRTQQVIQEETGIADIVDPLGGSFYIEWLTNTIEDGVIKQMDEIKRLGGLVQVIKAGWLHKKISEFAFQEERLQETGVIKLVGQNFPEIAGGDTESRIDVFRYPKDAERRQLKRLARIKETRSEKEVEDKLHRIVEAASKGENLFTYVLDAVRARATEGEIVKTFSQAYGASKTHLYL